MGERCTKRLEAEVARLRKYKARFEWLQRQAKSEPVISKAIDKAKAETSSKPNGKHPDDCDCIYCKDARIPTLEREKR